MEHFKSYIVFFIYLLNKKFYLSVLGDIGTLVCKIFIPWVKTYDTIQIYKFCPFGWICLGRILIPSNLLTWIDSGGDGDVYDDYQYMIRESACWKLTLNSFGFELNKKIGQVKHNLHSMLNYMIIVRITRLLLPAD